MTDVLTLRLDARSQLFFEVLRQRHFPPERNLIAAHLTLFHTLPDDEATYATLEHAAARPGFALRVNGLRSLGKGVAYTPASAEAQRLHGELAEAFAAHLSAQDRQRFQPHVVVQNKTTPERAKLLLAELQAGFQAFEVQAVGLDLWHYLGGPWRLARHFPFTASDES